MTLPTGIYSSIMQGFAGNLSDTVKTNLWQQFTSSNGLSSTPPETSATEAQFVSFLVSNANNQTLVLSPSEIQRRQSLATVIEIILKLMKSVQETDVAQNALLLFYAKYQKEYMKMQGNVPIHLGAQSAGFNLNPLDPSKTVFGYNNISVMDVANYLTANPQGSNLQITSQTSSFYNPTTNDSGSISYTFSFVPAGSGGNGIIELYLNRLSGFTSNTSTRLQVASVFVNPSLPKDQQAQAWATGIMSLLNANTVTQTQVKAITVPSIYFYSSTLNQADRNYLYNYNYVHTGGASDIIQAVNTNDYFTVPVPPPSGLSATLTNILNGTPETSFTVPGNQQFNPSWTFATSLTQIYPIKIPNNMAIPWRYTTENVPGQFSSGGHSDADENFVRTNAVVQQRAAENQKLQQFIEGIKSHKETIQSNNDAMNNNIQSSNSNLKGQMSVISSTLKTLRAILAGIFS